MTLDELRTKRATLRAFTTAPRTVAELLALPDDAVVTPVETALLLRISLESLMINRSRGRAPIGFRLGGVVRFTMGEIRGAKNAGSAE
jgi:hypothetical protein